MHLRRSCLVLGFLAVLTVSLGTRAAVVYKWTDADGVVHFSDQPVPGAEKVVTGGLNTAHTLGVSTKSAPPTDTSKPKANPVDYRLFAITSPEHDQTFTGNSPVMVNLALDPLLKADQTVTWSMNGVQVANQAPDAVKFTLTDLSRGTYTLTATVTDLASGQSRTSDPVSFTVMLPSLLSPQHK